MAVERIEASGLGKTLGRTPEYRLFRRPKLVEDLVRLSTSRGTVILGAERQTLSGESVEWVDSEVTPLLDGTRTFDEILAEFPGLPTSTLHDVLVLLQMHGLVEEADDDLAPSCHERLERAYGEQLAFFSRYLGVSGRCRSRFQAQRRVETTVVLVAGPEAESSILLALLGEAGFTAISASGPDDFVPEFEPRTVDIVVSIGCWSQHVEWARTCRRVATLLLCVEPNALVLGPLVHPGESPCPTCAREQLTIPRVRSSNTYSPSHGLRVRALLARAAQCLLAHATGLSVPKIVSGVELWSPGEASAVQFEALARMPRCVACGHPERPATTILPGGHREQLALLYHGSVVLKTWQIGAPASIQGHFSEATGQLMRSAYAEHPWVERIILPQFEGPCPRSSDRDPGRGRASDGFPRQLSTLLRWSAGGVSEPASNGGYHISRFLASVGNLGSAELYVVVGNGAILPAGVYHYLVVDHSLERLRGCERIVSPAGHGPQITVIVAGAVDRCCAKYGERGYQYCLIDGGLMVHRLEVLAAAIGLRTCTDWSLSDAPACELLGSDGLRLAPFVQMRFTPTPQDCPPSDSPRPAAPAGARQELDVVLGHRKWLKALALRLQVASGGALVDQRSDAVRPDGESPMAHPRWQERVVLPGNAGPMDTSDLIACIGARRSGRIATGVPLALADLSSLLASCQLPGSHPLNPTQLAPSVRAVAFDVTSLRPGVYRFEAENSSFVRTATAEREAFRRNVLLQHEHGDAAAILFLVLPLEAWIERFCDRGYRGLCIQTGWLLDRLYLTAQRLGLGYTASGGFAPAAADLALGLDPRRETAFFSFIVAGRQAEPGKPHV